MTDAFRPVARESLSDRLAHRIRALIHSGDYKEGDRLPAIIEMARRFGVGHPTVREALKKLESMGVVEIRHGSGVYVCRDRDVLVLAIPGYTATLTKKLLLDLIEARTPLEVQTATLAATNASEQHLADMQRLLTRASENIDNDELLNATNMAFHKEIAAASGNTVLAQLLDVLQELFTGEQRLILGIFGSRTRDHAEHLAILDALQKRDAPLAGRRMRKHLIGVADAVQRWDPETHPVS